MIILVIILIMQSIAIGMLYRVIVNIELLDDTQVELRQIIELSEQLRSHTQDLQAALYKAQAPQTPTKEKP